MDKVNSGKPAPEKKFSIKSIKVSEHSHELLTVAAFKLRKDGETIQSLADKAIEKMFGSNGSDVAEMPKPEEIF